MGCATFISKSDELNIKINDVVIHIISDRKYMPCKNKDTVGCASRDEVWVLGYLYKGKIIINSEVLGHEMWHIIQQRYPDKIHNPDKYKSWIK